jgi:hypothetical protein
VNTPAKGKIKMKVGFSLGRCVRDIVNDIVTYDDVAFIITGTALRDEDAIKLCVSEYMYREDYLYGFNEEICQALALRLFTEGKLFQPRLQGIRAFRIPEGAIWADLFPTNVSESDAVKKAWDAYRFMLHMTTQVHEDLKEHLS